MEHTGEAETDEEWEDVPLSDDTEGELQTDDGDENEKYPLHENHNTECSKGSVIDEEQIMHVNNEEAAPVGSVRVRMWRSVRRIVKLSVLGLVAVTAVLVILEPMLPPLDDDEV